MSSSLTSATYIRNISYGLRRQLSDFLDPQDRWKDVIVSIRKPSGEPRYSQLHVRYVNSRNCLLHFQNRIKHCRGVFFRRFEGLVTQGKSPTVELLNDWGTTNCTVGELVDILKSRNLLAAASLLLPCNELLLHIVNFIIFNFIWKFHLKPYIFSRKLHYIKAFGAELGNKSYRIFFLGNYKITITI